MKFYFLFRTRGFLRNNFFLNLKNYTVLRSPVAGRVKLNNITGYKERTFIFSNATNCVILIKISINYKLL